MGCAYSHWLEQRWRYRWKYYNSIARWDTPRQRSCAWRVLALSLSAEKGGGGNTCLWPACPSKQIGQQKARRKLKKESPMCVYAFSPSLLRKQVFPPSPFSAAERLLATRAFIFLAELLFLAQKKSKYYSISSGLLLSDCKRKSRNITILSHAMPCLLFVLKKKSRNITVPLTAWY